MQFENDIDEAEQGTAAACSAAFFGRLLSRVVEHEYRDAGGGEPLKRLEHFQQRVGVAIGAAGEEGGEGIDDEEIEFAFGPPAQGLLR